MKHIEILFFVSFLAAQLFAAEAANCETNNVKLSGDLKLVAGAVNLPSKNTNITVTMVTKDVECDIRFVAYKSMPMEMTLLDYSLGNDKGQCAKSIFKAVSLDKQELKVCADDDPRGSIKSTEYITVTLKASENNRAVVLNFKSSQGNECGSSEIKLTKMNETITFPMGSGGFTKNSECDILVTGLGGRPFRTIIQEINLADGACTDDYIAFSDTVITTVDEKDKKCKPKDVTGEITAKNGMLYIKIVTVNAKGSASVTLRMETNYPECGPAEVVVPTEGTQITLPASGHKFQSDTTCDIKVSGKDGLNFSMKITNIKFPDGKCQDDYVSASTTPTTLPNPAYTKCGSSSVDEPFKSANGLMYLKVKTKNVQNEPTVTLQFQSGAGKPGQYSFLAIILFKLLSTALC